MEKAYVPESPLVVPYPKILVAVVRATTPPDTFAVLVVVVS
jgi:hypothetical protein